MANPAARVTPWTVVGTILLCFAIVFVFVAEFLPYWQQSEKSRETGIPNVGLWSVCFRDDGYPAPPWANDGLGKRYYGCNYVFDRDLRMIRDWIYPAWFIVVVLFVTLGLVLLPLNLILNILYYVKVISAHHDHVLLLVSSIITLVTGFIISIGIIIFGIMSDKDVKWMPNPESNYLSFAFAICAAAPVLCYFCAMCHAVDYIRLKFYKFRNARANVYMRGDPRY